MSKNDNEENQERFFEPKGRISSTNLTPLSIFLSVLAALIVALLLKDAYDQYRLRKNVSEFVQGVKVIGEELDKEVKKMEAENTRLLNRSMRDTERAYKSALSQSIDAGLMYEQVEDYESSFEDNSE